MFLYAFYINIIKFILLHSRCPFSISTETSTYHKSAGLKQALSGHCNIFMCFSLLWHNKLWESGRECRGAAFIGRAGCLCEVLWYLKRRDWDFRILASYEAKTAKISNLCTFWPVIQLINPLCRILKRWFISWITVQNVQKLQIFAVFAP